MKQFLRITIVVLIMVAMGFGGYALFFKPANKDEVYLALSDVSELKLEDTYIDSLKSIDSTKFLPSGTNSTKYTKVLDNYRGLLTISEDLAEIKIPRIADGDVTGETVENSNGIKQYTYPELKSKLDDVFNYYLAYSQAVSKKIPKSTLKNIKNLIKSYESSLGSLVESINSIKSLQTFINEDAENKDYSSELEKRYQASIVSFRNCITDYVSLIQGAKDFVSEYVFNGNMITDKESLLQDLMLESLKKATSQAYGFNINTQLNTADDYMKSATQIITLATDKEEQNNLGGTARFCKETVTYVESFGGRNYNSIRPAKELVYNKFELNLRLETVSTDEETKKVLYFGDTNIIAVDGAETEVTIGDDGSVTASENTRMPKATFEEDGRQYFKFVCYVNTNGDNANKLYFFDEDDDFCDINSCVGTTLTHNFQVSEGQVVFTNGDESISYDYTTLAKKYLKTSLVGFVTYFEITDDGQILNIYDRNKNLVDGFEEIQGLDTPHQFPKTFSAGVYHQSYFYCAYKDYAPTEEDSWVREALSYAKMIKCYNRIMNEDASVFAKIIELSTSKKIAFVQGDTSVRASFIEVLHDDIEYLLACCGFYE